MKLEIEKWVEEKEPFMGEAENLFKESVLCYKVGAYKSAFIMSYLAFKMTIRQRIIQCNYRPEGFTEEIWRSNILNDLEDEDVWEKQLNDIIKADPKSKQKKAIIHFEKREQTINQFLYWKDYRNDCVHGKGRTIDSSTIEEFWNYLKDNLSKFYVLGGKEYLLKELQQYYKYFDLEKYKDTKQLLYDISVVYRNNTDEFFRKFFEELSLNNQNVIEENNAEFWGNIINSQYNEIREGIIKAISNNQEYFVSLYKFFPKILNLAISFDEKFIIDKLVQWLMNTKYYRNNKECFWNIVYDLLNINPNIVDIDEITKDEQAMSLVYKATFNEDQIKLFNNNEVFKKFIINAGDYFFKADALSTWYNSGSEYMVVECFKYIEWDKELVLKLNKSLAQLYESIENRSNEKSKQKGYERKEAYEKVIIDNKDKIVNCIDKDEENNYKLVLDIIKIN